jgi:hypothetical protein
MSLTNLLAKAGQKTTNEPDLVKTRDTDLRGIRAVSELMLVAHSKPAEEWYSASNMTNDVALIFVQGTKAFPFKISLPWSNCGLTVV